MATRSNIGIRTENGTIIAAYCHCDGYLAYNGQMLFEHYVDVDEIVDLVALGSFTSLKETAEETAIDKYNADALTQFEPEEIEDTPEGIKAFFNDSDREYLYVYDTKEECWYYAEETYNSSTNGELKLLQMALEEKLLV